jgi:hypothetical protein
MFYVDSIFFLHVDKVRTLELVEVLEGAWVDGWGVDVVSVIPFHHHHHYFIHF